MRMYGCFYLTGQGIMYLAPSYPLEHSLGNTFPCFDGERASAEFGAGEKHGYHSLTPLGRSVCVIPARKTWRPAEVQLKVHILEKRGIECHCGLAINCRGEGYVLFC